MKHWKDYPRIGLKGFSISMKRREWVKPNIMASFILYTGLVSLAAYYKNSGAQQLERAYLESWESQLKIVTGKEMFRAPLPEKIFFLSVDMRKGSTLSWAWIIFLLTSCMPPLSSSLNTSRSSMLSCLGVIFFFSADSTIPYGCLTVR